MSEEPLYTSIKPYPVRLVRRKTYTGREVVTESFVVRRGDGREWAGAYYKDYARASAFTTFLQAKGD